MLLAGPGASSQVNFNVWPMGVDAQSLSALPFDDKAHDALIIRPEREPKALFANKGCKRLVKAV